MRHEKKASRTHLLYFVELELEFLCTVLRILQRDLEFVCPVVTLNLLLQLANPLLMLIGSRLHLLELRFPELDFTILGDVSDSYNSKGQIASPPDL